MPMGYTGYRGLASPLSVSVNGESIACGGGTPGVIRY
jgi:hypothetical protein